MDRDATARQVRLLGDVLGRTIAVVEGDAELDVVERVRALAKATRRGDEAAGTELTDLLTAMPTDEARIVVTAFAAWFRLVNLAEDQGLVRQLAARSPRRCALRWTASSSAASTPRRPPRRSSSWRSGSC